MRIALVGDYPLDPNKLVGGPQAVFTYLLEGLSEIEELDLHVISAHKQITKTTQLQRDGVTFHFLPFPRLPFNSTAYPFLRRRIHQVLHWIKPDLVHAQSADVDAAACLGAGYPTIATAHNLPGTEPRYSSDWISRVRLALSNRWTSRIVLPNIRHIISISEYIRQGLAPRTRATLHMIDNPVGKAFFELPLDQAIAGRLLFVGLLRHIKRPDLAVEALALARREVPGLHLQFAGGAINPEFEANLRDLVMKNSLERNVELLGHLQEAQLLDAYKQMSILLLTSDLETSPMAVEQAMAAGKPVIATAVGGVPYLIDNGRTGLLVEPGNTPQMAEAIVRLVGDDDLRASLGQAARSEALSRFHTAIVAQKTCAVYKQILNG